MGPGEREQRSVDELEHEVERLGDELAKAVSARDLLIREVLPVNEAGPSEDGLRHRRVFSLAAVLVLLLGASALIIKHLSGPQGAQRAPRVKAFTRPVKSPRLRSQRTSHPRRQATIPLSTLSVLGRVALGPKGHRVCAAGWGGHLLLLDLRDDGVRWRIHAHQGATRDVVFANDGTIISAGADGAVKRWRVRDGALLGILRAAGGAAVRDLALAGKLLIVGVEAPEAEVYRLSKEGAKLERKLGGHKSWVRAVAISRGARQVATGDHSGKVRIFSLSGGELVREVVASKQWSNALAFSPDGAQLAVASFDKRTRIFEVSTGKRLHAFRGHSRRVVSVAFSPSGEQLVTASHDRTAVIWDVRSGKFSRRLRQHRYTVSSAVFGPKGECILTACTDGSLRLWPRALPIADNMRMLGKPGPGELTVRSNTTGERMRIKVLSSKGKVLDTGRETLAYMLRSGPDDRQLLPNVKLVKHLYAIVNHFGRQREVLVISGFRSDEFNALRTQQSRQVAKESRHRTGEAIDFRISGVGTSTLQRYVKKLRVGGVGFYPDSQFIHFDVGPVRSWGGN
ncbi:MAG: DUF882 domain-containing protein [Deltaproteobacteria bacterium]|nr:DUF882 domain-containing protein [Deltaproteobacteria bacterium]